MTVLQALRRAFFQRYRHVAKEDAARLRVFLARLRVKFAGRQLVCGKAQNVSGPVHVPVLAVESVDALVIREQDAYLALLAHALCAKGGIYRPENETPRVRISKAALFTADHYLRAHYSLYTSRILASR